MRIALSTDHAGFGAVKQLASFLTGLGHEVIDYGPKEFVVTDDYPDFIRPCAEAVASGECEVGIIYGGSGQGEAMVANRVKGARCGVFYSPAKAVEPIDAEGNMSEDEYEILKLNRQHNHANMLSLAARFLTQQQIEKAVKTWLDTPWSDEERHSRRVKKIDEA
ncbi:hypothetical protein A3F37_04365 [Candidatus Saccharibacteria bacterium RIFCSPHIGHO2_12_FULL_41_12]|nr:MAG: hypothetical protein A3F37_04365 [Candidatus Saccharibacteria bacterium RIFCSPHIGHO2_12_FULL_41_12]